MGSSLDLEFGLYAWDEGLGFSLGFGMRDVEFRA